jgi:uncharacterized protein
MSVYRSVYLTPGVYRQPQPAENSDIRLVRTDVAGFVGFAERGPLPRPGASVEELRRAAVRLTSWQQFLTTFGGFMPYSYLAYAVRGFFDNGGTTCYVVRVAALTPEKSFLRARPASFALPGGPASESGDAFVTAATAGDSELTIFESSRSLQDEITVGDLIEIRDEGATERLMVVERDNDRVRLARKLSFQFPHGAILAKYEPAMVVTAISAGNWGNRIKLTVTQLTLGNFAEEFALRITVTPGLDPSRSVEEEFYHRLSLARGPFYAPDHVNTSSNLITLNVVESSPPGPQLFFGAPPLAAGAVWLQGGQDGFSEVTTQDFIGGNEDFRGLRLIEEVDEVAILCVPDAVLEPPIELSLPTLPPADPCVNLSDGNELPPTLDDTTVPPPSDTISICRAMIDQCERLRYRVAILDYPKTKRAAKDLQDWKQNFVTRFGAIYYPWLKVSDPLGIEGLTRQVPAAGHIAGIYARLDNQFGAGRPPANAGLEFVTDVAVDISDLDQQDLNPNGINAIRSFQGRGIRVWGARSLARANDSDWLFIHVRRLMSMIEKSVEVSTRWAVFEPNNFALRRTLVHSLSVFLEAIWRTGALKGTKPADGFYVKCDETNNPPSVVDAGRIVCEVGVAVAAPMEFIVFEIHQDPVTANLVEVQNT